MIKLEISHNLTATGCPKEVIALAKKTLTLPNPAYHRITRMTGSAWAAARDFKFYQINKKDPGAIRCPRGFAPRFKAYLDKYSIQYEETRDLVKKRALGVGMDLWPEVELRPYQKPILEQMVGVTEGVVAASTGAGKTVLTCALARELQEHMTILVPTTIIQDQFAAEFKKWFGYDVGIINGSLKEIKPITVAMWQSLAMDEELVRTLAHSTSVLVVDEAHGIVSKARRQILEKFKPNRLYGLSGSPKRSEDDGRTKAIFFYLGPIVASYEATQIVPTVDVVKTRVDIPVSEYAMMEDEMVQNESRNNLLAGIIMGEMMSGKKVLVLLKRREHCEKIMEKLPKSDDVYYADSDDPWRNETLLAMRSGEKQFSILIGTFSLLATGTDIPCLDVVVFGGSLKSDVLVAQGAGRVLRLFEGKESAKIYDLYDNLNPIYQRQAWARFNFYRQKRWKILGLDYEKKN